MSKLGVTVAVMQGEYILLTKREDLEIWCLPGGEVEAGESLVQAAIRETREETGLDVRLTRLIGAYSRLGFLGSIHSLLFAAEPVGGALRLQPGETVDVGWFRADALPSALMAWHQQPIQAALQGAGQGLAWTVHLSSPLTEQVKDRQDLYALRGRGHPPNGSVYRKSRIARTYTHCVTSRDSPAMNSMPNSCIPRQSKRSWR